MSETGPTPETDVAQRVLIATTLVSQKQRRIALVVIVALLIAFVLTAPFAKIQLQRVQAFIPALQSVMCIINIIVAVLLFAQYAVVPQLAILAIACGYLFVSLIVILQALTFPGAFAPTGLLGAGLQTAAWLYYFWHMGFALAAIIYVQLKNVDRAPRLSRHSPRRIITLSVIAIIAMVIGLLLAATIGQDQLPSLLSNETQLNSATHYISATVTLLSILALVLLWLKLRFVLDLWLLVTIFATLPDIALAIFFSVVRYSAGWYLARIYALVAASILLVVLITETTKLYVRLARTVILQRRLSAGVTLFLAWQGCSKKY
jgi:hypothetical protein